MRMIRRLENKSYKEKFRELGVVNLEKKKLELFKYLKAFHMEEGTDLFPSVSKSRTRSNGQKLQESRTAFVCGRERTHYFYHGRGYVKPPGNRAC